MNPETRLVLLMLPHIEQLASTSPEAARLRDEMQAHFDARSRPLRDAIGLWGRERGVCFYCVDWCRSARRWRFESRDFPLVEVDEAGSRVWAGGAELPMRSASPRVLKAHLTRLLARRGAHRA